MLNIAICDDDPIILDQIHKIITKVLKNDNQVFILEKFENSSALLDKNQFRQYDIIFLDIDMPVISGFDIAKEIRERGYDIYVIFLTSYAEYMQSICKKALTISLFFIS